MEKSRAPESINIAHQSPPSAQSSLVGLNVGGYKYLTSRETLLRGSSDNFFSGLLNGKIASVKDSKGNYFIDRNGRVFEHVLDYLRTGKIRLPKDITMEEFDEECDFYMLGDLFRTRNMDSLSDAAIGMLLREAEENKQEADYQAALVKHKAEWEQLEKSIISHWVNDASHGRRPQPIRIYREVPQGTTNMRVSQSPFKEQLKAAASAPFPLHMRKKHQLTIVVRYYYRNAYNVLFPLDQKSPDYGEPELLEIQWQSESSK